MTTCFGAWATLIALSFANSFLSGGCTPPLNVSGMTRFSNYKILLIFKLLKLQECLVARSPLQSLMTDTTGNGNKRC
jgi:hypothetical protein